MLLFLESNQCNEGADVAFVIDSSENVTRLAYQREKDFVKELMRRLVEKRNNLNAAAVIYSNKAFVKLNFSQGFSLQNFNFVIDMLPYLGGKRTIRSPTDSTVDQLFRPVFIGPRTHLPKVAIQLMYFTDRGVIATPFITFKDRRISTVQLYAAFFLSSRLRNYSCSEGHW